MKIITFILVYIVTRCIILRYLPGIYYRKIVILFNEKRIIKLNKEIETRKENINNFPPFIYLQSIRHCYLDVAHRFIDGSIKPQYSHLYKGNPLGHKLCWSISYMNKYGCCGSDELIIRRMTVNAII